jgi:hypothetical protein
VITTEERQRRAAVAATNRAALIADTPPTTRPGSEKTRLKVGDHVRVARTTGRSGTWAAYEGRKGWVASLNRQKFPNGATYVEIGVAWNHHKNAGSDAWFRADELEAL